MSTDYATRNQDWGCQTLHPIFRVQFVSQDKVFEVFAKQIYSSDLYGFIEVEEFVFGERSGLIGDPSEEKLKAEFQGVKRSYILCMR